MAKKRRSRNADQGAEKSGRVRVIMQDGVVKTSKFEAEKAAEFAKIEIDRKKRNPFESPVTNWPNFRAGRDKLSGSATHHIPPVSRSVNNED